MKKNYSIKTNTDDEIELNLISDYWENNNGQFKFSLNELSKKYSLKSHSITKIIKEKSEVFKETKCYDCQELYQVKIETKGKWNPYSELCQNCQLERTHKQKEFELEQKRVIEENERERRAEIENTFQQAISEKRWLNLNQYKFETLKKIINLKELRLIKKEVYNGNFYDKQVWIAVNKLNNLGLIFIRRDDFSNHVHSFEFSEKLENEILQEINTNIVDYLSFSLVKKMNRTEVRQPNYSGTFTLQSDILLKAGEKYIYGGWEQTDGSINLKFTPIREIEKRTIQTDIEKEPKHISDILNDFFDEIK